ncbi:MAG: hypothetical protein HY695_30790 [Deltaproteobacteria bacterium]|nr:hypothetical protein [Deltaproteobacteria bacterium]
MVGDVVLHLIEVNAFEVATGHEPGGKGQRRAVLEKIEEIILASKDHGQMGLGVGLAAAFGGHMQLIFINSPLLASALMARPILQFVLNTLTLSITPPPVETSERPSSVRTPTERDLWICSVEMARGGIQNP